MRIIFICSCLLISFNAFNQTFTWTGDGDGTTWSDEMNWDSGDGTPGNDGLPQSDDDVNIIEAGGFFATTTINITEDVSIQSLLISAEGFLNIIDLNVLVGQTLSISGNANVAVTGVGLLSILDVDGSLLIGGDIILGLRGFFTPDLNSLVNYNGTIAQTVLTTPTITYGNLTFEGNSEKNIPDILDVDGDLTISNSSIVNLNNNDLNLAGNLINNSVFNAGTALITFDGTVSPQTVEGNSSYIFQDMQVSNPLGVNINGEVDLIGTLTLTGTGVFDADGAGSGDFTIRSTSVGNGDARIAPLLIPDNFSGNVTVERFIDANVGIEIGGDFEYISVPVNGADLSMWIDDFPITGSFTNPSLPNDGCLGCENVVFPNRSSAFFYDASVPVYIPLSGTTFNNVPLINGVGYAVFTYRDDDYVVDVTGTIATGTQNIPIETGQFNLVGNPYPSAINGNNLIDVNNPSGELNGIFYIRTANGDFASFDANSDIPAGHPNGNLWAGEISMGQSFWVNSISSSQFTLTENDKIPGGNGEFLEAPISPNILRIVLEGNGQDDETVIILRENSTTSFEPEVDGFKFRNGSFNSSVNSRLNLASFVSGLPEEYIFNYISSTECFQEINLRMIGTRPGEHTLNFAGLDDFSLPHKVQLVDNFLNETIEITNLLKYNFEITDEPASFNDGRFSIQFINNGVSEDDIPEIIANDLCSSDSISLVILNSSLNINYSLQLNDSIQIEAVKGTGRGLEIKVDKRALVFGTNVLDLTISNVQGCSQDILVGEAFTFEFSELPILEVSTNQVVNCGTGVFNLIGTTNNPLDLIRVYENENDFEPILEVNQGVIQFPEVSDNELFFLSAVNQQLCETERIPIEIVVNEIPEPVVINDVATCYDTEFVEITVENFQPNLSYYLFESIDSSEPVMVFNDSLATIQLSESASFFISAQSSDGCESERSEFLIDVIAIETPVISEIGNVLISSNQTHNQWFRNGELLIGETNDTLIVFNEGEYFVQVSQNACSVNSETVFFTITSTLEQLNNEIELYPNPLFDELHIKSNSRVSSIRVFTVNGVAVKDINTPQFDNAEIVIDLTPLNSGIYLVQIETEEGAKTIQRIIKN